MDYLNIVDKNCTNVLSYCNSMIQNMLDEEFIETYDNADQLKLAEEFLGCPVLYLDDNGNKCKGLLVFMFIDITEDSSMPLQNALDDKDIALEKNFKAYMESEVISIIPEILPATSQFQVKRYLKELSDFDFYYNALVEDGVIKDISSNYANIYQDLLEIKLFNGTTEQKKQLINDLSKKSLFQPEIIESLVHLTNEKPNLQVV